MADNVVKIDSRQCIILRDFGEKIVWLLEHHSITLDRLYKLPISVTAWPLQPDVDYI